jgi:phage terminase small subunit
MKKTKKKSKKKVKVLKEISEDKSLNTRQKLFVHYYLADKTKNAKQCYIKAGYQARGNSAEVAALNLLRNVKIEKYVKKQVEEQIESLKMSAKELLDFMVDAIKCDIGEYIKWDKTTMEMTPSENLTPQQRAMIQDITITKKGIKLGFINKNKHVELLCRHYGIISDNKIELPGLEKAVTSFAEGLNAVREQIKTNPDIKKQFEDDYE